MSLSKLQTALLAGFLVLGSGMLSGCSFSPVYGGINTARAEAISLRFAEPTSRLEQVILQELRVGFPSVAGGLATSLAASATISTEALSATMNPRKPREATVSATLTIDRGAGADPIVLSRAASASFDVTGQVLADQEAERGATETAGRAVAESLRLAILASTLR